MAGMHAVAQRTKNPCNYLEEPGARRGKAFKMLDDTLIRKFKMKRHLLWGEYKTVPGVKKGKKYNAKIWMPVDKLQ